MPRRSQLLDGGDLLARRTPTVHILYDDAGADIVQTPEPVLLVPGIPW